MVVFLFCEEELEVLSVVLFDFVSVVFVLSVLLLVVLVLPVVELDLDEVEEVPVSLRYQYHPFEPVSDFELLLPVSDEVPTVVMPVGLPAVCVVVVVVDWLVLDSVF